MAKKPHELFLKYFPRVPGVYYIYDEEQDEKFPVFNIYADWCDHGEYMFGRFQLGFIIMLDNNPTFLVILTRPVTIVGRYKNVIDTRINQLKNVLRKKPYIKIKEIYI